MKRLAGLLALAALLGFGLPACSDDSDTPPPKVDTVITDGTTSDVVVAPDGVKTKDGTASDVVVAPDGVQKTDGTADSVAGDLPLGDLPSGDQTTVKADALGGLG